MTKKNFEDFISKNGKEDIYNKANELHKYLKNNTDDIEQGLGLQLMSSACSHPLIKDRKGHIKETIMLGSNSYFNLTTHPKVVEASSRALKKYGYGMGSVSLYAGITDLHEQLEMLIAEFHSTEDAVLFPSGYGTNIGVIASLCQKGDVVINDSANHASIFDGCILSGADIKIYPHNNMRRLEQLLSRLPKEQKGRLIATDGVFSMHGDLAPLDKIVELAQKYNTRVLVDDGHGIGIVGATGRGTAEVFGVQDKIDLNIGMLSKTPGGLGGYCAGSKVIVDYLRLFARTYFFSTALPAPLIAGLIEVFKLFIQDKAGRKELWKNIKYMKDNLEKAGFNVGNSQSGIVPIIIGDEKMLGLFHKDLIEEGVYTNVVSYPAVRRKECRVRLCIMSTLTKEDMNKAILIIENVGKKHGLI